MDWNRKFHPTLFLPLAETYRHRTFMEFIYFFCFGAELEVVILYLLLLVQIVLLYLIITLGNYGYETVFRVGLL